MFPGQHLAHHHHPSPWSLTATIGEEGEPRPHHRHQHTGFARQRGGGVEREGVAGEKGWGLPELPCWDDAGQILFFPSRIYEIFSINPPQLLANNITHTTLGRGGNRLEAT